MSRCSSVYVRLCYSNFKILNVIDSTIKIERKIQEPTASKSTNTQVFALLGFTFGHTQFSDIQVDNDTIRALSK